MLSFFPRNVLDEILNLIESVSEGFPTYSFINSRSNCLKPRNAVRHKAVFLCSLYCKNSVFFFFWVLGRDDDYQYNRLQFRVW